MRRRQEQLREDLTPLHPASFETLRPGRLDYAAGLSLQQALVQECLQSGANTLVLLEHSPVITLGRGATEQHILASAEQLQHQGTAIHRVSRGGEVTWHGPGQLVGYPIIHLDLYDRDLHRYLRLLEETLIRTLAAFRLCTERRPGSTGVWVEERKIASIGVAVRRWVSWHGFALNLDTDPLAFSAIVPCGLSGVTMTSLARETGTPISTEAVERELIATFAEVFGLRHTGDRHAPAT